MGLYFIVEEVEHIAEADSLEEGNFEEDNLVVGNVVVEEVVERIAEIVDVVVGLAFVGNVVVVAVAFAVAHVVAIAVVAVVEERGIAPVFVEEAMGQRFHFVDQEHGRLAKIPMGMELGPPSCLQPHIRIYQFGMG